VKAGTYKVTGGHLTVAKFRELLTAQEASWSALDREYFGEFGQTPLLVQFPHGGVGIPSVVFDYTLGIWLLPDPDARP
jgi:hypothetical protein